jgi:hypothetical protein
MGEMDAPWTEIFKAQKNEGRTRWHHELPDGDVPAGCTRTTAPLLTTT